MIIYAAKFITILLLAFGFDSFLISGLLLGLSVWVALNFYYIVLMTFLGLCKISLDFDAEALGVNWVVLLLNTMGVVTILKMTAYTTIGWMLVPSIIFAIVCSAITTAMYFGFIKIANSDDE